MLNLFFLCPINAKRKSGWQQICLQHGFLNKLLRTAQKKRIPFNILLLIDNTPARALMETNNDINAANTNIHSVVYESRCDFDFQVL